jgi:hypothetical protein
VHEVQFLYVKFVTWQILRIVGSHIEIKRIFNVACICTNLRHFWSGIENFETLINIYKTWPNDAHVEGLASMKQFKDMEEAFMEENESWIDQVEFFDIKENGNRL